MRSSLTCPKCQSKKLLHVRQVAERTGPAHVRPWFIAGMSGTFSLDLQGAVEAFVCRQCGYAEFYVANPGSIRVDGDTVKEIEGPPDQGPYR